MTHFPRPTRAVQRWLLLCLLLAWGIVFSSPIPPPQGMTEVCSSSGTQWVQADDSPDTGPTHTTVCWLCLPAALPTPPTATLPAVGLPSLTLLAQVASHVPPAPAAMPPPARGPPLFQNQTQEVHT